MNCIAFRAWLLSSLCSRLKYYHWHIRICYILQSFTDVMIARNRPYVRSGMKICSFEAWRKCGGSKCECLKHAVNVWKREMKVLTKGKNHQISKKNNRTRYTRTDVLSSLKCCNIVAFYSCRKSQTICIAKLFDILTAPVNGMRM